MPLSPAAQRFLAGPLLSETDEEARVGLSKVLRETIAPAGASLIAQGVPNDRLWFLIEGSAEIVRIQGGEDKLIARIEAPGIFGATTFFRPGGVGATVSIRTTTPVTLLTLDHEGHDRLRREQPRAAESLALATIRVLAERFDQIDLRVTEYIASHADDHPRSNEWAGFRARLFGEPNII